MGSTSYALTNNPLAPDSQNGMQTTAPPKCVDVAFDYIYDVTLTALQFLQNQSLVTTNDADFLWCATVINVASGSFNIRFSDSQGYYLSNSLVASANILGDASSPDPVFPGIFIPAGGRIGIDIQDSSNSNNTIQIAFRGWKRYRIQG